MDEMEWSHEDACQELRQILETHPVMLSIKADEQLIVRTGNPLPQDSSFIPLHQAVSHLQVSEKPSRPRSFSVGLTTSTRKNAKRSAFESFTPEEMYQTFESSSEFSPARNGN
ncbi:hypothetical protein DFQ28_000170 [Apophysomyces sp. BC1034]|nr:hypothetical protein DFQ29_001768 [Apophysomyces sp. BC1021]KAG0191453.1 hypothetical protein DFQ28_000170 [Apophysomyces sp. BC1034]